MQKYKRERAQIIITTTNNKNTNKNNNYFKEKKKRSKACKELGNKKICRYLLIMCKYTLRIPHKNTNGKKRPNSYPKMSAYNSGDIRKLRPSLRSQFFVPAENAEF
jgi:hypothetical protein